MFMNKYSIIALLLTSFSLMGLQAQKTQLPFFDPATGNIRLQTTELDALSDTIATVSHRSDDVVWARVVYRVIDLREKQNYRLYFPVRGDNPTYRSLFQVILEAVVNGDATAYERGRDLVPKYDRMLAPEDLHANTMLPKIDETDESTYLVDVNPLGQPEINMDNYAEYSKDVFKYIIQEVVFFDKHTSRMYTKIIGIAPLYAASPEKQAVNNAVQSMQFSILFWVYFDELRPSLAKQYAVSDGNEVQRLTYDEFFTQKLYDSYILGDSNMFNRSLLDYENLVGPERFKAYVQQEQNRIETELLNFEQDLWEY